MANDLISRSEAIRRLMACSETWTNVGNCSDCKAEVFKSIIETVKAQSAVDAEPVRHGYWVAYPRNGRDRSNRCSVCNKFANFPYKYCPHCNAKMDGGEINGYLG